MKASLTQGLMTGGAIIALAAAFAEAQKAATWGELLSPPHFFAVLGAAMVALGAWYRQVPQRSDDDGNK